MKRTEKLTQLDLLHLGVLSREDAPRHLRLQAREELAPAIRKLFNPVAEKHGLVEFACEEGAPVEAFYWGEPGAEKGVFVVVLAKGRLSWVTPVASGSTPALLNRVLSIPPEGPLEKMHQLLREHGWEGQQYPHSFRNMWFWTLDGKQKPVEFITHRFAFTEETLGCWWRWRIEKADFEPEGTCMELGKLARDRQRHTVESLQRRLEELDTVSVPVRPTREKGRRARADVTMLEKMLGTGEQEGRS